jgi:hypothetical protein
MDSRADAAEALGKHPALARVATAQDGFEASPHRAAGPRLVYHTTVNLDIDAQMTFDAGNGIN